MEDIYNIKTFIFVNIYKYIIFFISKKFFTCAFIFMRAYIINSVYRNVVLNVYLLIQKFLKIVFVLSYL